MNHGTRSAYVNGKCRCAPCTNANRTYNRTRQQGDILATRAYNKKARDKRREILDRIKLELGCEVCGYDEHACALDFHHTGGDKVLNVASHRMMALDTVLAEIDKCSVLCANCHRVETHMKG